MTLPEPRSIGLTSVSIDLGAGRRGVDMGPSALRIAGLNAKLEELGHTVREVGTVTASAAEIAHRGESQARYLAEITDVCRRTRDLVESAVADGCFPLNVGGDHSIAIGTISGVARHYRRQGLQIGAIWADAHADMNTPASTPSGNIHGMALSVLLGEGPSELVALSGDQPALSPQHVCILGARSIDASEAKIVKRMGVRVFTMSEIDERGMAVCIAEALARATAGTAGVHLSFDLDSIDPQIAPGVGTPVPGGTTYREAHLVCEKAARSGKLIGMDLVELNPVLDHESVTARLGIGLVASALGKTIL